MAGSLSDISKATGLGVSTVSEILRDNPNYRPETRQIVLEAARKLNYRPNLIARGLKTGKSNTIGIVVGSLHTPITMAKLVDIETTARQAGYTPFIAQGPVDEHDQVLVTVDHLLGRQVDGLIVMLAAGVSSKVTDRLKRSKTPVVYVDWTPEDAAMTLAFDRMPAKRDAAAHLAALGHREGIFCCTPSDWYRPGIKFAQWQQACEEQGITLVINEDFLFTPSRYYEQQAYDLIRQRALEGKLPRLLLMNNDACAMAAMAAMQDVGLRIPQDISVVGYDDTLEATYCRPSLTTIHQPRDEVGAVAFEMLLRGMESRKSVRDARVIPFGFVPRQSTGPAADRPPRVARRKRSS